MARDVSEVLPLPCPRACRAGREPVREPVRVRVRVQGEPSALSEGLLHPLIAERLTGHFPVASLSFYFSLSQDAFAWGGPL